MDKRSRTFFNALNTFKTGEIDVIDINNLTLEEILEKYTRYGQFYCKFIENQKGTDKEIASKMQKKEYDKMFRFWINPFHIALRNQIGKIGLPKPIVEKITTDKTDKAILTQETIDKIKRRYIAPLDKKVYNINPDKAKEELIKILQTLLREQQKQNNEAKIQQAKDNMDEYLPIRRMETYTFDVNSVYRTYINKYKVAMLDNGIEHSIEVYGDIDLNRFYSDNMYRRVVLEAIEDLEIEDYLEGRKDKQKNGKYIGYIGHFYDTVRDGIQIWQQEIKESDLDAINKMNKLDEKYKMIARKQNDCFKLGDVR